MGSFIIAGIVFVAALLIAVFAELARGMATAPSMQPSYFWTIFGSGLAIGALIVATHWLPRIGW